MPRTATKVALTLTPILKYRQELADGVLVADPAQARAIEEMERIFKAVTADHRTLEPGLLDRIRGRRGARWTPVDGLYLWGPVGRGKTYIVDAFFDCLPFPEKQRIHFHSFMRQTHDALKGFAQEQDPLNLVAGLWSSRLRVLCLDEFHVGDITDAMLLANLLQGMFNEGMTLIATSNEAPDELYSDGLQRARFLPAIGLIKKHMRTLNLDGGVDYRLRELERAPVFYDSRDPEAAAHLGERFDALASEQGTVGGHLHVEGRDVQTVRLAEGIAWFEFDFLCCGNRSARRTV